MSIFSDRLKSLRKEKKLFQKDVATLLQITERQYSSYEAGKVDPPTSKTILLADLFDTSIDYLVGRTNDRTRH